MNINSKIRILRKTEKLAELIGVVLGDGHIEMFPRTEELVITCNSFQRGYIKHLKNLVSKIFHKEPSLFFRKNENTIDITLYQCNISRRLEISSGNKIKNNVGIPLWIYKSKKYILACLKGLFETDGTFQKDSDNYAQYIEVKNSCSRLREDI